MTASLQSILLAGLLFVSGVSSQGVPELVGTWSTKSNKVFTGPGFYDPVNEKMVEPSLTGISYSFTADGFYEEAYYRAIPNPGSPQCPEGIMQWQHGTYTQEANGSLVLNPFAVDGRQLLSSPCNFKTSTYTRYAQQEVMKTYQVLTDPYHNVQRLNLAKFDGSPMIPMYLAYQPPQMLPTQTLNPTSTSGQAQATGNSRVKRDLSHEYIEPLNKNIVITPKEPINPDRWWWIGMGLTAVGGVAYVYSS